MKRFVETSQPQISMPFSTPIFIDSIVPITTTVKTPLEVPIIKSVLEDIKTSSIPSNTSNVEPNANIGVSLEPSSSVPPTLHKDVGIMFGNNQEPLDDFVFHAFTFNINSDNDDSPMTKVQFKELHKNLDSILEHSNTFSSTK